MLPVLLPAEKALDNIIGKVEGVFKGEEEDAVVSPFMLDTLLLELDLLKGGGARRDGEGALEGGRERGSPFDDDVGVRKGIVAALFRLEPLVLDGQPALLDTLAKPYLEDACGDEGGDDESKFVMRDVLALGALSSPFR